MTRWNTLLTHFLHLVAPDTCAACQSPLPDMRALYCVACAADTSVGLQTRWLGEHPAWAIGSYAGPFQTAIARFKFGDHPELARRFGFHLGRALLAAPNIGESEQSSELRRTLAGACLVPVPLHPKRLAERGFNQAGLLAQAVARETRLRCDPAALVRRHDTTKQSQLDRAARLQNLTGSIAVRHVPAAPVILVDDVLTTGATLSLCAETLRTAGASVIGMLTIAHTD
jgi:ComF family protein